MPTTFPSLHGGQPRVFTVYNESGETIPAYAVMRITGVDTIGRFTVDQPDTDGQLNILVNDSIPILAGQYGQGHNASPCPVLYDSGDGTPAAGDTWGVKASQWKLALNNDGAYALSAGDDSEELANFSHSFCRLMGAAGGSSGTFSGARVYQSGAYTVNHASATYPTFNTARYNVDSYWSSGTNPSRLTIPTTGYYHFGANCQYASASPADYRQNVLGILLNGSFTGTLIALSSMVVDPTTYPFNGLAMNVSGDYHFSASDYIEVYLFQANDLSANRNTLAPSGNGNYTLEFWIHKLG